MTATVVALSLVDGGFYPTVWGWASLAAVATAAVTLVARRRVELERRDWLVLALFAAFVVWTGSSALWSGGATRAVPQVERGILYATVLLAGLFVVRRPTVAALVHGLLAGVVAVSLDGLAIFLLRVDPVPDEYQGRLLFAPLGYANAMGALAAMGSLLALGVGAHSRSRVTGSAACASLVPLLLTLSLTSSRGAEAALLVAAALVLAVDPGRSRLLATVLVALPFPVAAIWLASRSQIADAQVSASVVARDGVVVAAVVALLTIASAATAYVLLRERRSIDARLPFLATAVCVVVFVVTSGTSGVLGDRLAYWQAALVDYRDHPFMGSGAGSYRVAWLQYRTTRVPTLNAHSLFLETLAELGPVGLALLVAVLALPFAAAFGARRRPLIPAALGAYTVAVVHTAVDWDWQMPAVTVTSLLCAVALLASGRRPHVPTAIGAYRGALALAGTVAACLAAFAAVEIVGNAALASAVRSSRVGAWEAAQANARRAARWAPWSATPLLVLGETQLASGDVDAARRTLADAARRDRSDWRIWLELARLDDRRAPNELARLDPLSFGAAADR